MKTFEFEFGKYITVHPSLRKFIRFLPKNECDEEFSLIAKSHNFQDCLDPYMDENGDFYVLKYEYLSKTPGYFSIHAINSINIEMSQYFKQRFCKEFGKIISRFILQFYYINIYKIIKL